MSFYWSVHCILFRTVFDSLKDKVSPEINDGRSCFSKNHRANNRPPLDFKRNKQGLGRFFPSILLVFWCVQCGRSQRPIHRKRRFKKNKIKVGTRSSWISTFNVGSRAVLSSSYSLIPFYLYIFPFFHVLNIFFTSFYFSFFWSNRLCLPAVLAEQECLGRLPIIWVVW